MNEQNELTGQLPHQASDAEKNESFGAHLSVGDAARRYTVSIATLRRKLKEGEIPGAFKAPGPKGDEWRLPVSGLEALGYRSVQEDEMEGSEERTVPDMHDLFRTMNRLMDIIDAERRQLIAAGEGHRSAEVEAARLQAALSAETERRRRAEVELNALRTAHQRQQQRIAELSERENPTSIWGSLSWALLFAGAGALVAFFVTVYVT